MNIQTSDYFLTRFCQHSNFLLRRAANWETRCLDSKLAGIPIERPVFITGLARAGTTLMLELLASIKGVATHRYRDFPFLMIPYFWNRCLDWFPVDQQPVERAHKDRIFVTRENPEAMEEPLWHTFFPHVHSNTSLHRIGPADGDPKFERFYRAHIRKILLVRAGTRYVAKANYHVPRLEYLAQLFPDARFVIVVRHPMTHVHSLVRQHGLFSRYAAADARVPRYLAAAGHFEFGPQRVPIRLRADQSDRILAAWSRGDEYLGYSIQWKEIYGFVESLRRTNPTIAQQMVIIRYEDLCDRPKAVMRQLLQSIDVDPSDAASMLSKAGDISQSQHVCDIDDRLRLAMREEVGGLAELFDYQL